MEMAAERWPSAPPGLCLLYFNPDASFPNAELYQSRVWGLDNPTILRCFEAPVPPAGAAPTGPAAP